jgi:autotransporter-associated beta strand protein
VAARLSRRGALLLAGLIALLAGNNRLHASNTNFNWISAVPLDYSVAAAWDRGSVPNGSINYVAMVGNGGTVNFASPDNVYIGQLALAPSNSNTGYFHMTSGTLVVSNNNTMIPLFLGGYGSGTSTLPNSGVNGASALTVSGGSLTIARNNNSAFYQDGVDLGVSTNASGVLTVSGGTVTLLCGMEIGVYGLGTVNLFGGTLIDNSWFGIGRGSSGPNGSGVVNITNGILYLIRNSNTEGNTTRGFYFCVAGTNGLANISGGTIYCNRVGFAANGSASEIFNMSGGNFYVGSDGVSASTSQPIVTISGGVFHTVNMVVNGTAITLHGSPYTVGNADTNSVLPGGTNWSWAAAPSVTLTNSIPGMGGVGYVTFAPEAGCTITLNNSWTGNGGFTVNGPGTVAMSGASTYTGNTTLTQGTLAMLSGGSISSANILVSPGGTFSGPGAGSPYILAAGQTLSNQGSTPTLSGNINTGSGTVALNYAAGTPAFTVAGGTLALSSSTIFTVNNTGPALGLGSYKIISAGSGGAVAATGGLPPVAVTGGGTTGGQYVFLAISGNELYLTVATTGPPAIASAVTNNLYYGSTWQLAIADLASQAGWSDPAGQAVGLSSVSPFSADGTNITTDGTFIYYNGIITTNDSFNYTITNSSLSAMGVVYLNEIEPTAMIPTNANNIISLNGTWDFYFERSNYNLGTPPNVSLPPDSQAFQLTTYVEGAGWSNMAVPGNWEMAGYSPCTYFSPDDTCGLYRKWIQIPQAWQGQRVYLALDGVLDGAEVWLNGQPVPCDESSWNIINYHESGWTGFQVDLTSQVQFGTSNLLAIRVIKSTPSDDLDTGDYFVIGGIYRSVTLFSVPQTNFADVHIQTTILPNSSAQVSVTADVPLGNASTPVAMFLNGVETDATATNGQAIFTQVINQPNLWSSEFPNLYTLTLNLKDGSGFVTETVTNRFGIRQITITNGVLYLNGAPVKFAGVCDHDSSAAAGSAVDANFWRNEILEMKAANINAIRTTHFPFDPAFYDMCDQLGMYVADELPYCWCDNETPQASMQPAFEQRARETIRRDRNHPSVVIWAIGNENTAGNNLQVVANLIKSLDTTRPRLVSTFNASQYNVELSDAHYPSIATMQTDATNAQTSGHPFIFLENPNTWDERLGADAGMWEDWGLCMQRCWNVCQQYATIPGTFPFEWSDRAVDDPNSDASYQQYKSTGVQQLYFFPATGIHLLKMKGMVDGFRNERPSAYELQMIYSPIQVSNTLNVTPGHVSFQVQNRYAFTDLSYLTTAWQLQRSGWTVASGAINPGIPPLSSGTILMSLPSNALAYADTLRLDFIHPNGNDVMAFQFALTNSTAASAMTTNLPAGLPIPSFNLVTITNYNNPTLWTECKRFTGSLTNIVLTPTNATTLNQMIALSATVIGGPARTQVLGQIQAGFTNGTFSYTLNWTAPNTNIQEVGWTFQMPANCDHFSWNRAGRWTVYPPTDIARASGTAVPASTNVDATDMDITNAFDFNSTKYNCTWAALTTAGGAGLRLGFNAQPFHCRAGAASNGNGYVLYANQQVSPAEDISSNVVPDLFMTLGNGSILQGSFTIGSNTNLATAGNFTGPINILYSPNDAFSGNPVELNFSGAPNTGYSIWTSTNLLNWLWDGGATQLSPGQYQFLDAPAPNTPQRYYYITSP